MILLKYDIEENMDYTRLIRKNILALEPYSTARDEFKGGDISVWLDANESPYQNGVNRYPDPHQKTLKLRISSLFAMPAESIFVGGAGSDEAIDLTFRIFCQPGVDNAVAITPSYGVYSVAAAINDVELREVELGAGSSLPVERILAATDDRTKLIWICSPNNPTGNAFPKEEILRIADSFGGMVVVDEAYGDFSDRGSMLPEISGRGNIIVLRTFSKAWGMAGLRCGMAFADPAVIAYYDRVKYPYNMSSRVQREILERIEKGTGGHVGEIKSERIRLAEGLAEARCVLEVYPSDANFLLVRVIDADDVYSWLTDNGVIVRNRSRLPLCAGALRITVGTPEENDATLRLMKEYSPKKY